MACCIQRNREDPQAPGIGGFARTVCSKNKVLDLSHLTHLGSKSEIPVFQTLTVTFKRKSSTLRFSFVLYEHLLSHLIAHYYDFWFKTTVSIKVSLQTAVCVSVWSTSNLDQ